MDAVEGLRLLSWSNVGEENDTLRTVAAQMAEIGQGRRRCDGLYETGPGSTDGWSIS